MAKVYWMGIIGPVERDELPARANELMRMAIREALAKIIGKKAEDATDCWADWGLTPKRMEEIQEVWNCKDESVIGNEG